MTEEIQETKEAAIGRRLDEMAAKTFTRREAIIKSILLGVTIALVITLAPTEARAST